MMHTNLLRSLNALIARGSMVASAALITLLAAGCSDAVELGLSDSGSTQTFSVDEEFDVLLGENGSTGMGWSSPDISEPSVLGFISDDFESSSGGDGAGGTRVFTFECLTGGEAVLEIVETNVQEDIAPDRFEITVVCEP